MGVSRQMWMLGLLLAFGCGDPMDERATQAEAGAHSADAASDAMSGAGPSDGAIDGGRVLQFDAARRDGSSDTIREDATLASDGSDPVQPHDASAARDAALSGWKLVWHDEFDGPRGALPSAERWLFETGGHGFGNNQLEFNTARAENASLDGEGKLVISARREDYMGKRYTSARLKTQGKFARAYGRYEARMQLPRGQGIWPAFWMLGSDIDRASWPACGEIDVMENIGREPSRVHGTLHGPGYAGGESIGAAYDLPANEAFANGFHLFAIEWEVNVVRWYVDGKLYQTRAPRDLPAGAKWVYDHPFFLLLNLAVGGQWPGNPDDTTTFPQRLTVDYVRVYERAL